MRRLIKEIMARIPMEYYHRVEAYSILKQEFPAALSVDTVVGRSDLWDLAIDRFVGAAKSMTYVEFGVWRGESIRYFAAVNRHDESVFIGLDSFEGLPEQWLHTTPRGHFSTNGLIPIVRDRRVQFIKGWFQDTWGDCHELISRSTSDHLVVHYDADLYSSTLFALTKIDELKRDYYAIFDEFTGHETRALYNYCQAYGAKVEFVAKTTDKQNWPLQVLCRISPQPPCAPAPQAEVGSASGVTGAAAIAL